MLITPSEGVEFVILVAFQSASYWLNLGQFRVRGPRKIIPDRRSGNDQIVDLAKGTDHRLPTRPNSGVVGVTTLISG
jgi:hypothetical protein